jgi:hypothetical protein
MSYRRSPDGPLVAGLFARDIETEKSGGVSSSGRRLNLDAHARRRTSLAALVRVAGVFTGHCRMIADFASVSGGMRHRAVVSSFDR